MHRTLCLALALVASALAAGPAAAAPAPKRPTVYLLHAGAWSGWSPDAQADIARRMGPAFGARGLRVRSLDYAPGTAGLASVLEAVRADAPARGRARHCFYGESAGGHLALLAARDSRATACVIAFGAPLRLSTWAADSARAGMPEAAAFAAHLVPLVFGPSAPGQAPWDPYRHARSIRGDVLLIRQEDDVLIPPAQADAFRALRPATQLHEVADDDARRPENRMVHGWITPRERVRLQDRVGTFAARALRAGRSR